LVSPESSPHRGRLKLYALWALAAVLLVNAAGLWALLNGQPLGMDFLPLWTAGRFAWSHPGQVYDFAAVSHAQGWLLPGFKWLRPFANPPTALLLLAPLGALPFWPALGLWMGLGIGLFALAGARLAPKRPRLALILIGLCPAVVIAAIVGQSVLLASALMVLAIIELERRPRLAGGLIALAAAIKPQIAMLAPVALIAGGAIEALVSAALIELLLVVASAVIFGPARWSEWLVSLPAFQAVVDGTPGLTPGVIAAGGAARLLGLTGWLSTLWRAAFALIAVAFVWKAFARREAGALRLAALAAGTLLAAPYAMHYDGALLAPAAVALAIAEDAQDGWMVRFAALIAVCAVTAPGLGSVAVLAFAGLVWRESAVKSDLLAPRSPAARLNPGGV
jgi:hypothetical protein